MWRSITGFGPSGPCAGRAAFDNVGQALSGITAPLVLDGPMDGAAFRAYVQTFPCPTLRPGDIVIADNLGSHKVAGVQQAIAAVGARSPTCRLTRPI